MYLSRVDADTRHKWSPSGQTLGKPGQSTEVPCTLYLGRRAGLFADLVSFSAGDQRSRLKLLLYLTTCLFLFLATELSVSSISDEHFITAIYSFLTSLTLFLNLLYFQTSKNSAIMCRKAVCSTCSKHSTIPHLTPSLNLFPFPRTNKNRIYIDIYISLYG